MVCVAKFTLISESGALVTLVSNCFKKAGLTSTGSNPLLSAFPLKISAKKLDTTTLNP